MTRNDPQFKDQKMMQITGKAPFPFLLFIADFFVEREEEKKKKKE